MYNIQKNNVDLAFCPELIISLAETPGKAPCTDKCEVCVYWGLNHNDCVWGTVIVSVKVWEKKNTHTIILDLFQ